MAGVDDFTNTSPVPPGGAPGSECTHTCTMQTNLAYELLRVRSMLVVVLAPLDVMKERKDTRVV